MCTCLQEDYSFPLLNKHNVTIPHSNETVAVVANALRSIGPQVARQFLNKTVVSAVLLKSPEMIPRIDPYWYNFPPLDPVMHKIIGVVMIILGFLGMFGNGMVVYIFLITPGLRSPSNILVVNLAFSDFIMMTTQSPPMVLNAWYETWMLGPMLCDVYAMVGALCGSASIWSMVAIAADRYNVIVKGMSGTPLSIKKALLELLIIWLFSLGWSLAPIFGWNRYIPEGNMTACGTDYFNQEWISKSYILIFSLFVYYTPLFSIITCYYFIISTVAAHERGMREQAKKMNVASLRSGDQQAESAEAKLAKVALTTISLWFMAWTPYLVINYMGIFGSKAITPIISIWGALFAKANACYNPIVYAISHPKFRAALDAKCPCLVCGALEKDQPPAKGDNKPAPDAGSTHTNDGKA